MPDAVDALRGALDLWHGPALTGLDTPQLRTAAEHLDESRLGVLERRIRLDLELGRHRGLVDELTLLVARHPCRESLVDLLMVALARTGQRSAALRAYQRLRERLVHELGVDPGPDLLRRYEEILRTEPRRPGRQVAVVTPGGPRLVLPAQLPRDVALVGRRQHLNALDDLVAGRPGESRPAGVGVVTGVAGIGKSSLAVHWAHRMAERFPDGQLYVDLRGFSPGARPMSAAEAVRSFLDAFDVPPDRIPAGLSARVGLYRSLLVGRRMLIVLDNARDVDQVRPLLPNSPRCPALVTSRHQLFDLVVDGARPMALGPMPADEARQLIADRVGVRRLAAEPSATEEILGFCAGLPLALATVAARAILSPTLPLTVLAGQLRDVNRRREAFPRPGGSNGAAAVSRRDVPTRFSRRPSR